MRLQNTFYLMRHGEAENNVRGIISTSVRLFPLTTKGRREVATVARALKRERIEIIVSSPVRRARQTAAIVGRICRLPVRVDVRLCEIGFGPRFNNHSMRGYVSYCGHIEDRYSHAPVGGETLLAVQQRVAGVLRSLNAKYHHRRILLVSHGDPLWLMKAYLLSLTRQPAIAQRQRLYLAKGAVQRFDTLGRRRSFTIIK